MSSSKRSSILSIFGEHIVVMFCIVVALTVVVGMFFLHHYRMMAIRDVGEQLKVIADLKLGQITHWRKERISDGNILRSNPFLAQAIYKWLVDSDNGVSRELPVFLGEMISKASEGYSGIFLVDTYGNVRLRLSNIGESTLEKDDTTLAIDAVKRNEVLLSDFHLGQSGTARIDLVVPIRINSSGANIGCLILQIDPKQFLYPLIQSWPISSASGETLLVRREGDEVRYLNELRHREGAALSFGLPIYRSNLPAAYAVFGVSGVVEGTDYRDVAVVAYLSAIPETNWFIIAKVDRSEGLALFWKQVLLFSVTIITFLVMSAALMSGFWMRRQVAERKKTEQTIREYSEKLEVMVKERTAELDHARSELFISSRLAAMGRLAAGIAHQLNSPLGGAMLLVDGLIDRLKGDAAIQRTVFQIRKAMGNMHNVITCMLSLASVVRRGATKTLSVDINSVLNSILDVSAHDCSYKGVVIKKHLMPNLPHITAQVGELDQVFLNLINNAIDAMPAGGMLSIMTRSLQDAIEIFVSDTGEGIPKENLGQIFEPFFTTRQSRRGVGLGLSIVHEIVHKYKGTIHVESEVGKGTKFVVRIPFVSEQSEA